MLSFLFVEASLNSRQLRSNCKREFGVVQQNQKSTVGIFLVSKRKSEPGERYLPSSLRTISPVQQQ